MVKEKDFKKQFQRKLKKLVKPTAILQYKQDATTIAGFPDTLVIMEGITVFIEFKQSKKARFRPGQKEWLKKLDEAGHFTFVCYPENAEEILKELERLAG